MPAAYKLSQIGYATAMLSLILACLSAPLERNLGPLYDADGDGQLDLVVTAPAGDGGQGSAWLILGDLQPVPLRWEGGVQDAFWGGDTTGDGRSDLILRGREGLIRVQRGPDGVLTELSRGPGSEAWAADVDGDGAWDLVVLGDTGLSVALGGDLGRMQPLSGLDGLLAVQVGDLDQDGAWELVTLTLQQGPAGVRTALQVYPGGRAGLGEAVDYSLPDGVLPSYLRVMAVGLQTRIVVGMDPVRTFGFQEGKIRPEAGFELLDGGGRDLLHWQERAVFHQGERLVASDGELLISAPGLGTPLLRDLDGDGIEELVVGLRGQAEVRVLGLDGQVRSILAPEEPVSFPTGRVTVDEGQTVVLWQGRAYGAKGERPSVPERPPREASRVETEWGALSWAKDGTVTWHGPDGDTPVLFETGAALSLDVQGDQGVVLGVQHGLVRSFRFQMGPQGPGPAKVEPPPSSGPSWFGAQVR